MGRRCFVPNCPSGSRSCAEKVSTFTAPSDPERLAAWANAIGRKDRELRTVDCVCEKHFTDDMIVKRRYYGELGGEVLLDAPKKPVLHPQAVPCVFPVASPLAKERRAPRKAAAHDNSAKRAKLGCSVRDLLLGRGSSDELGGAADSNASPPTSIECGDKTSEPPRPAKIYLPHRSCSRLPSQSSAVTSKVSDLSCSREISFPTQSSAKSPVCSNMVKSEPSTEPRNEECFPATPVEASFPVDWSSGKGSDVFKREPSVGSSEVCEPILPAASNFPLESSCQTSVCLNVVESEPSTEPRREERGSCTQVASTCPLKPSCQDPVPSCVIKSEPFTESCGENRVHATSGECDISLQPSCQAPASSGAVTGELPFVRNEEPAQENLPGENEQACKIAEERQVILPSSAWMQQDISVGGVESLCFVELRKMSPSSPVLVFKSLDLEVTVDGLKITKSVLGRTAVSAVVQVIPRTEHASYVSDVLRSFDKEAICRGGPAGDKFPGIRLRYASIDAIGFWRHNKCKLCVDDAETQCAHCRSLSNTLRVHTARKKKQEEQKHARLLLRKSKKRKLAALCRQRDAWQCCKRRLEDRIRVLHSKLVASRQKVQALSSAEIFDVVKGADIPETYRVVLSECLAATSVASKNSRRYSDKWIELCRLLHKRTPSGYRFLRETNMLPLPSTKTLRKYGGSTNGGEGESTSGDS